MKKMKKSLQFFMSFVLALSFLIAPFPILKNSKNVSSAPLYDVQLIDKTLLNYITISTDGQTLSSEEIKSIDTNGDKKPDTSFVFANRTVTLTFDPLTYGYETDFDSSLFYTPTYIETTVTKLESQPNFPTTFTIDDIVYNYSIANDGKITIKHENKLLYTDSEFVEIIEETTTSRTFRFLTSYTLKPNAPSGTTFSFTPYSSATQYTINFERPIVNFKNEDVTLFTCKGLDIGDTPYTSSKIEKELSYENVKFQITNNNYTENNPIYFDINHDGFIYTFKLFSKTYGSDELLFVEYYDDQKIKNHQSLATILDEDGNVKVIPDVSPVYKYDGLAPNFNMFSIDFDIPGRYEISVYDETHRLNLKDKNFYTTSFYIKTSNLSGSHSAFENAYAIMQKYDDEGNLSDYIVSGSTQNSDVKITIKNLPYYFENDDVLKSFVPTEETPELVVVEFIETVFTSGVNDPVSTLYTADKIKEALNENSDFVIECKDDAFYQIFIYQYELKDGKYVRSLKNYYQQFTIVKEPKINFTVFKVDENNNRIEKPGTNQFETETERGSEPFKTTPKSYKINIDSWMNISRYFTAGIPSQKTYLLEKTYLNEYTIDYAMQAVKIARVEVGDGSGNKVKVLGVQFFGVGNINVEISVNSSTQNYTVKSGEVLTFEEYGTYTFTIEDSMGTVGAEVIKYPKPVNTSVVIMIGLIGVIVLAVVLFIISSRGKVKTR